MSDWEDGVRGFVKKLFGDTNEKRVKLLQPYVVRANTFADDLAKLSDADLQAKTGHFKIMIENALKDVPDVKLIADDVPKMPGQVRTMKDKKLAEVLEDILPEAFAVCREAGSRVLNMRHFDVQLMGGAALHFNKIAEMRTGEGKTLVATLPTYLNALAGRGAHVVTVNDYLARRDSEWMGRLYGFLGMSTGLVYSHQPDWEKAAAYRTDITYGTNHEYGFDYLRDNMRKSLDELVQRPYYFGIVDEVDNILIDEARTPLIISGYPRDSFQELYQRMAQIAPLLERGKDKDDEDCDYFVDEKQRNVMLTERGIINGEKMLGAEDLFDMHHNYAHHLVQALRAKEIYKLDTDYVIYPNEEGKPEITIVDEFTGRMMQGRRWSDGLHQAIEAKERVPIQEETMTYASITYQNLFRLYPKLAGMTGTAMTEAQEFSKIYNLDVVTIPTNKNSQRKDHPDVIYKTEQMKYISVVEEIVDMHEVGRPVLVGTVSIEKSELIDDLLSKPQKMNEFLLWKTKKIEEILTRRKLDGEQTAALRKILERPGQIDAVKLDEVVKKLEKDLPKEEDLLDRAYSMLRTAKVVAAIRKGIPHAVLNAKHHEKEAMIVAQAGRKGAVTVATNMAGRGTDILLGGNAEYLAKEKLAKDFPDEAIHSDPEVMAQYEEKVKELTKEMKADRDKEHDEVTKLGGLHIIGTERHEARRIDNQLRGRAGRQGDPGTTRFFLSLEDQLMRIFGGQAISKLMDLIKADEDMPIESGMVSNSIEGAQKKVEAHHFDMRKHVLQYDDVLSTQREVIYRERRRLLEKADLRDNVLDMLKEHLDLILEAHLDPDSPPDLFEENGLPEVLYALSMDIPMMHDIKQTELKGLSYDDLKEKLWDAMELAYKVREEHIGAEEMREFERQVLLHNIDSKWVDYLHNIDLLREGIQLRAYAQKDPLQEYKREAFNMFNQLLRSIQAESIQQVFRAQPQNEPAEIFDIMQLTPEMIDPSQLPEGVTAEEMVAVLQMDFLKSQGMLTPAMLEEMANSMVDKELVDGEEVPGDNVGMELSQQGLEVFTPDLLTEVAEADQLGKLPDETIGTGLTDQELADMRLSEAEDEEHDHRNGDSFEPITDLEAAEIENNDPTLASQHSRSKDAEILE
ncbi:MAG: preprotein translocase subunit SecA [Candidatus Obscuribacter sp.]|nr:preprotein translocase subunit SecA [Candidatus Obscuribacter sp.]